MRVPRVLLLWPGTTGAAAGNFGVPQLVTLGSYLKARTRCEVAIRDLVAERALGAIELPRLFVDDDGEPYDVIGISVYASFDWLKCEVLARVAREAAPNAVIVAGGYHASARPPEIVAEGSPFDVCVVGEGEKPMARVVESVAGGAPLRGVVLGSDPIEDLDAELPETDWTLLDRYRGVARQVASQTQLYLSRGCPFDCAFCMERAKRDVSWRAHSVERAVEEIRRLHAYLDLRGWTLYVADALFGMKKTWRREVLSRLASAGIPVDKFWLLIRVDLVEDEDVELFADANCGLGFGLESGDETQLATIRKAGRLDTYLERMRDVAELARRRDLPWGANVIVGHPGETRDSMVRSAAYLRALFLDGKGTTGFLSVDPFRLYPGSPIDAERAAWEARYGTRFHRPSWWHDGDPEFLSEWVDPSADLDWATRESLTHTLFAPIVRELESHYVYSGSAKPYFLRAIRDQVQFAGSASRLHMRDRYYAWQRYLGRGARAVTRRDTDEDLAALARTARERALPAVAQQFAIPDDAPILEALRRVPRERFVPIDAILASARDVAVELLPGGASTVSALHAYARVYTLAGIFPGACVVDLGAGTGYGLALLGELVGPTGRVYGVELEPSLVARAQVLLATHTNARIAAGDALDTSRWGVPAGDVDIVVGGFALPSLAALSGLAAGLRAGAVIVAPVVHGDAQRHVRARVLEGGALDVEWLEAVRYVAARHAPDAVVAEPAPDRARRALPLAR